MTSRYYSLEDDVWFEVFTHSASNSGTLINADETPKWFVYEEGTLTNILADNFLQRTDTPGSYIGNFVASGTLGFETGKYYSVHASGKVDGIVDRGSVASFVIDDIYKANAVQVSGDGFAAGNLRDQFNGIGITNDTYPATQSQVENFAVGSAAVSKQAESYTLTTGTQSANTVTDTETADGVEHQHTDVGNAMELYYQFDIGGNGIATETQLLGRMNGSNDSINVFAYDWDGATWDQIGTLNGQASSINVVHNYNLLVRHTGTGANLGKIRIQFQVASGLTTATLSVDQIFTSYSIVSNSVGYSDGAVWIDTVNGVAGTESFVNGTADNPSNSLASAITIASNVNLVRFHVINGSSITFIETHQNETWMGNNWTLALGGQDIAGIVIEGATVSGIGTGSARPRFERCTIGTCTLPPSRINGSTGFTDTLTFNATGEYDFIDCVSLIAGTGAPTFDLGVAIGSTNLHFRGWEGGITFNNIKASDAISMEGVGGTITVNGDGGSINIRGIFEAVVDNSSAAVTITQTATLNRASSSTYAEGIWIDTNASNTGTLSYVDGTADKPVSTVAAAYTIAAAVNVSSFMILPGSSLTLPSDSSFKTFKGSKYAIALNGQDIEGTSFHNCSSVTGIGISGAGISPPTFFTCALGSVTLPPCNGLECGFFGVFTIGVAGGNYTFGISAKVFGTSPTIDFGSALNSSEFALSNWQSGDIEIKNAGAGTGTYEFEMSGTGGLIINANCSNTTNITVIGHINITNNSAITTINEQANYTQTIVENTVWEASLSDHTIDGTTGAAVQDTYFSNIKFVKDAPNAQDEYTVSWYKNGDVLSSGDLSNPAISVYNTVDGSAKLENQTLDFISAPLAVVRYNETTASNTLPSGEPFVVVTSGTIGGATRTWKLAIGLDDI